MHDSGSIFAEEARPSLARGAAAGAAAAVAGASVWALVGILTGYQVGFVAIGIGYLVGAAMARYGRTIGTETMAAAALIALAGALVGHLAWVYADGARETGLGIMTVIEAIGPIDVLTNTEITELFSWAFFLLAAFTAAQASTRVGEDLPAPAEPASSYPPPVFPIAPPVEPEPDPAPPHV